MVFGRQVMNVSLPELLSPCDGLVPLLPALRSSGSPCLLSGFCVFSCWLLFQIFELLDLYETGSLILSLRLLLASAFFFADLAYRLRTITMLNSNVYCVIRSKSQACASQNCLFGPSHIAFHKSAAITPQAFAQCNLHSSVPSIYVT